MSQFAQENPAPERARIGLVLPRDLREEVAAAAKLEDRSMSSIVRRAIEHELDRPAGTVES
jgi:predicted transcriptional regulator